MTIVLTTLILLLTVALSGVLIGLLPFRLPRPLVQIVVCPDGAADGRALRLGVDHVQAGADAARYHGEPMQRFSTRIVAAATLAGVRGAIWNIIYVTDF